MKLKTKIPGTIDDYTTEQYRNIIEEIFSNGMKDGNTEAFDSFALREICIKLHSFAEIFGQVVDKIESISHISQEITETNGTGGQTKH